MRPNAPSFAICLAVAGLIGDAACGDDLFQPFGYARNGAALASNASLGISASTEPYFSVGDEALATLGFGSLSVNFNVQEPNTLTGFRNYTRPTGPVLYVGNYGSQFTETQVFDITGNPSQQRINVDGALGAIQNYATLATDPSTADPTVAALDAQIAVILDSVTSAGTTVSQLDHHDQVALAPFFSNAQHAILALQTAQHVAVAGNGGTVPTNALATQIADVSDTLSLLNIALAGTVLDVDNGGGTGLAVNTSPRVADDLDGNGQAGVFRVLADIDGDGTVGSNEVIGLVNNYGDLHTFNVFFDSVVIRETSNFTSVELMKQHVFYASPGENTWRTGWRTDAFWDEWALGFGDEIRGSWAFGPGVLDGVSYGWLREAVEATRWSTYGTAGVRGMRIEDDFSFEGLGSILGRTRVATMIDHDIFGPQLGVGFVAEASMFRFEAVLLGLIGYGHAEIKQTGVFGEEAIPGALNRPATARTTASSAGQDDDYFAWHGETRITGSCQLTQHWRFDATWRGIVTGPVRSSSAATAWNAPDFGINNHDGETVDVSHWFIGLTYTH